MPTKKLRRDANQQVTKALPAANASTTTDAIDIGAKRETNAPLEFYVDLPDLANLAQAKDITIKIQDCDTEGGSYTDIPALATQTATGKTGGGFDAATFFWPVPRDTKQFVRAHIAVEDAGGDNTASSATFGVGI